MTGFLFCRFGDLRRDYEIENLRGGPPCRLGHNAEAGWTDKAAQEGGWVKQNRFRFPL